MGNGTMTELRERRGEISTEFKFCLWNLVVDEVMGRNGMVR